MGLLLEDPLYDRFATRCCRTRLYGGADLGECFVTAGQVTPADPESWHRAWTATGDRVFAIARGCAASGHAVSGLDRPAGLVGAWPRFSRRTTSAPRPNTPSSGGRNGFDARRWWPGRRAIRSCADAERLHDALRCPKALVRFLAAEGAGGHCEETARSLFHQRAYDWLDDVLAEAPRSTWISFWRLALLVPGSPNRGAGTRGRRGHGRATQQGDQLLEPPLNRVEPAGQCREVRGRAWARLGAGGRRLLVGGTTSRSPGRIW